MNLDLTTDFGARVARRLAEEEVIWLTTATPGGAPQPSPVWFLWDGESVLIYSQPDRPKLHNVERNPNVALNFNCTTTGGDVVVISGRASIAPDAPRASDVPAYLEKYRAPIARIGMTPESFAAAYSVAVRVTPLRMRGH
jgi:PPOX class probable F420-dependent enzyme